MKNYENLVDEHLEFMIRLACEAQEDAEIDELIAESQLEHTPEEKEITRNAYLLFQRKLAEQEQKERKQYFPDRLTDRYKEEGYFDFHASAFIGEGKNSVDGILLRTDIEHNPAMLYHILLHELAHVFCAHNELGGDSFYKRCCMDSTLSREEDGAINAGYAIWRELIAEVIAFEMDDNCFVVSLGEKAALLRYCEEEFENGDRKRGLSMILCEALTSKECEMSATWNIAQKKVAGHKPFDNPLFMDMLGLVFRKLKDNLVEIDRDFILELSSLYLCLVTQLEIRKLQKMLAEEK